MRLRSSVGRLSPVSHDAFSFVPEAAHSHLHLGELLVQQGALSPEDVERVAEAQHRTGRLFGEACLDMGLCSAGDIQTALNQQAGFALLDPDSDAVAPGVMTAFGADPDMTEKMRTLRSMLMKDEGTLDDARKLIVFAAVDATTPVNLVAANFAVVSAHLGYQVLLVDAALDTPVQHDNFRRPNRAGITTLSRSGTDAATLVQPTAIANLSLLPAGPSVPDQAELFERLSLCSRLRSIASTFDLIVVDAGHAQSDIVATLSCGADGAVIVVTRHKTDVGDVRQLASRLEDRAVPSLGMIIV